MSHCNWCETQHDLTVPHVSKTRWMILVGDTIMIYATRKKAMAAAQTRLDKRKPTEVLITPTTGGRI